MKAKIFFSYIILILVSVNLAFIMGASNNKLKAPKVKPEYIKLDKEREIVIRYYDINNVDVESKKKGSTYYITKKDNTKFNKEDMQKLNFSSESIKVPATEEVKVALKNVSRKQVIGYNVFSKQQKEYKTYQIGITNTNVEEDTVSIKTNYDKLYVDIFYASTKKVFVRHIDSSTFYDGQNRNIIGFDEKQIVYSKKINKENAYADIYNNADGNLEGRKEVEKDSTIYQESYVIPVDKNLEIHNVMDPEIKYVGYKKIITSNGEELETAKNIVYNGTPIKLGDLDNRIFTAESAVDTYVDLFYVVEEKTSPKEKLVGEVSVNKITPEGKVVAEAINNEFNKKNSEELRIPSSENIRLGIVNVSPYITADMSYTACERVDYENNGKNYFRVPYKYAKLNKCNIFTIKNNVAVQDYKNAPSGMLLDREENIQLQLKDSYLSSANNIKHLPYKIDKKYITENKHTDCNICKDTFLEVTVYSDGINLGEETIVDQLKVTTKKYKIKEEKCKMYNGKSVLDNRATKYYTPHINSIEKENLEEELIKQIDKAKNPAKIEQVTDIFVDNSFNIPSEKLNGKYMLSGTLEYENKFKLGDPQSTVENVKLVLPNKQVRPVIVYTPVVANSVLTRSGDIINHTNKNVSSEMIQKNTPFVVIPKAADVEHQIYNTVKDFSKYIREYVINFEFDLAYYKVYDSKGNVCEEKNTVIESGTNIKIPSGGKIEAQAVYEDNKVIKNALKSNGSQYSIKAVAINAPKEEKYYAKLLDDKTRYSDDMFNKMTSSHKEFHTRDLLEEKNYSAKRKFDVKTLDRMYDFRVVNLRDYDFDPIYKKADGMNLSGNCSYVGIRRLNLNSKNLNELVANSSYTLPLGPYKHPNPLFSNAPKMGYYFDFDLKTTGAFTNSTNKYIEIKPEFYYISKDGKTYHDQSQIDMYYKSGKDRLIKVGSSQDNYKISMLPRESEKYIAEFAGEFTEKHLAKDEITIGNIQKITLNANTNMVSKIKDQEQLWVGRYKLPPTIIVVNKNEKDMKNMYRDGYLGVKFNIKCIQKIGSEETVIEYGSNNTQDARPNTSQWDVEGYLGASYGAINELSIRLEKGNFSLNNDMYNKIKGTVMLYDLDRRAEEEQ